jgi:hypothetical protein
MKEDRLYTEGGEWQRERQRNWNEASSAPQAHVRSQADKYEQNEIDEDISNGEQADR